MSGPPQCLPSPRRVDIPARAGLVRGKKAEPKMSTVSGRIFAADAAFAAVRDFYLTSRYGKRRGDPSICDLTFGNPHEMPLGSLRRHAAVGGHEKRFPRLDLRQILPPIESSDCWRKHLDHLFAPALSNIKPRKSKRSTQFEGFCPLASGDVDRAFEGIFGGGNIGGVMASQKVTAQPEELSIKPMLPRLLRPDYQFA